MYYTSDILKIFYNCCELPITLLDRDYNIINRDGFKDEFESIFLKFKEENLLSVNEAPWNWCSDDNINYYVVPKKNKNVLQHFLIGPFKTNVSSTNHNIIPLIDNKCLKYLHELLINIIKDYSVTNLATFSPNISRVIKHVEDNYSNPICASSICENFKMNKCYFCRLFKRETGTTFIQYLNNFKIEKSKELLKNTNRSLLEITFDVGFSNQSYFSTTFKKITGVSPLDYRNAFENANKFM